MATDANILMGLQPVKTTSPMQLYEAGERIEQNRLSGLMNQMKMDEYKSGVERTNSLRGILSNNAPDTVGRLRQGGFLKESMDLAKSDTDIAKTKVATEKDQLANALSKLTLGAQLLSSAKDQASYDASRAEAQANGLDVSRMPAQYDPAFISSKLQESQTVTQQLAEKWKAMEYSTPKADARLQADTSRANNAASNATTMRGQNMTDARSRESNSTMKELGLIEKGLRIEDLQGKRDDRLRAKDGARASVDAQIGVIDKALAHPGRATGTGLSGSIDPRNYIPGTDATDFRTVIDQVGGSAFLQAFESLKGGGAITEMEGKKATDAIARLNRAQSDKEFETSLKDLRQVMEAGRNRLSSTGGSTGSFGTPVQSPSAPAQAPQMPAGFKVIR